MFNDFFTRVEELASMKLQSQMTQQRNQSSAKKRKTHHDVSNNETIISSSIQDTCSFEILPMDTIQHILKFHELPIGCEYERWLFLDMKYDVTTLNEQPSIPYSINDFTSWLIQLLYGYFKFSSTHNRQYYPLYSCLSFDGCSMGRISNLVQFVVGIRNVVYLDLKRWNESYDRGNREWWFDENQKFNHIESIVFDCVDPNSTVQEKFMSKCHNLTALTVNDFNCSMLIPKWSQLRKLKILNTMQCLFSISYLLENCKQLQELHIPHEEKLEDEWHLLRLFPDLNKLCIGLSRPLNFTYTGKSLYIKTPINFQLDEQECRKLLTGNSLQYLDLSYNSELIPPSCYQNIASNTSITSLDTDGAFEFWEHAWASVVQNQSIRKLQICDIRFGYIYNLFSKDHSLFEQLESLSFGFTKEKHNEYAINRLMKDAKNLTSLKLPGMLKPKAYELLQSLPKLQKLTLRFHDSSDYFVEHPITYNLSLTHLVLKNFHFNASLVTKNLIKASNLSYLTFRVDRLYTSTLIESLRLKSLIELKIHTMTELEEDKDSTMQEVYQALLCNNNLQKLVLNPVCEKHYKQLLEASRHISNVIIQTRYDSYY
jgi:hypothetical protein